ncbi:MAG: hypothetical protein VX777_00975 [Chlamydiota bacterium]|nr:hypothetical protein [Chlamydiota bacterium]
MQFTTNPVPPIYTTFLYPKSREYPFDEVCEKIVRALEKRSWTVPGIEVQFLDYEDHDERYRQVSTIQSKDFSLRFWRVQERIDYWKKNTAAIGTIKIPQKALVVYENAAGPTFYTYVGKNWEQDRESFMNDYKLHSKLKNRARIYLKYKGSCDPVDLTNRYENCKNPYLVNDTEDGKEYRARDEEPTYYNSSEIFREVNDWLTNNILSKIETIKETKKIEAIPEAMIPYPKDVGPFYLKIDYKTYAKIVKGQTDESQLEPSQRYAIKGGKYRLVSLGITNDGSLSEVAYDKFTECSLKKLNLEKYQRTRAILLIHPKHANGIFVADKAPAAKYKSDCFEGNPQKTMLTNTEFKEYRRYTGRTLIPIHEYQGNYKDPVILIRNKRKLSFDEVTVHKGYLDEELKRLNSVDDCVIS